MQTYLSELFSSIQGEGPYVGERHLFVRFCGCHRDCVFCDTNTQRTETVLVERSPPPGGNIERIPNPLTIGQVVELIRQLDGRRFNRRIAITGGSPLLQAPFLRGLLPQLCGEKHSIYLETAGDLPQHLKMIVEWIDVVAMDVKLSSVTQEKNTFPAHWQFLKTCRHFDLDVFAKLVLSADTNEGELAEALKGIRKAGGEDTLVVIQPMTKTWRTTAVPSNAQLMRWQETVASMLPRVRLIPQTHKMMQMR